MRFFLSRFLLPILVVSCTTQTYEAVRAPPDSSTKTALTPSEEEVLVGAGDIARCYISGAKLTANLLDKIPGTVFTVGDNVYQDGTAKEFRECYEPSWGRHKNRTRPSPGNHDYHTKDAVPYFEYFGDNAGPFGLGYYSYNLGSWHILSLNSNIPADEFSTQMRWLRDDLAKSTHKCTLAYWHYPVVASSARRIDPRMREIFAELYAHGVDVVVSGHEHDYERFAPMNARGERDPANGIRSFIVGTGGAQPGLFGKKHPLSEVRFVEYGVIKFTLKQGSYTWEFIPALHDPMSDSGSGVCH